MKFTFLKNASALYDLCVFPKLLHVTKQDVDTFNPAVDADLARQTLNYERYEAFVEDAKQDLAPYQDPLLGFYAEDAIGMYDFPILLFKAYSFLDYTDHVAYLDAIMQEDEDDLKRKLIYALLTVEKGDDNGDTDAMEKAQSLLKDREALINQIRNTPTTENHKWILVMLIDNPKDYVAMYQKMLSDILPIFERYQKLHEPLMETFEKNVIETLNAGQETAFQALTKNLIPLDVLSEENKVITSFIDPYRFSMMQFGDDTVMLFAIAMKHGFELLAESELETRKARVKMFKTLGDETRYDVLRLIASGVTQTKSIASALNVSSATVTYHVNAFLTAGIIQTPKSKKARYVVNYERLNAYWDKFLEDLKTTTD